MSGHIHLVLGGARSGKSKRAQQLASQRSEHVVYIATCATEFLDPEMRQRIGLHRAARPSHWDTIEDRFDLAEVIKETSGSVFLLDCLTLWLARRSGQGAGEDEILGELAGAFGVVRNRDATMIVVSNELGLGMVPTGADNRQFRDLCGLANQTAATHADRVEFLVAGLPWNLK